MRPTFHGWTRLGLAALGLWAMGVIVVLYLGYRLLARPTALGDSEPFPALQSTGIIAGPDRHAYQYIAAPNLTWEAARKAAAQLSFHGHAGYLATIDSASEYRFIMRRVFPGSPPDVTYLGGRQTAPGEWRWVTGPDAASDGGKGRLFWMGDEKGSAPGDMYADWMYTAFQHGGKWDIGKVCCVTLFSYGLPQFSTSLGNADREEGVSGFLVEFGD